MRVSWLFLIAVAAVLVTAATTTSAQVPGGQAPAQPSAQEPLTGGRPYRGIFGGGVGDTEQSLTVTGSIGGGYESDYLSRLADDIDGEPRPRSGGLVGVGSATLAYSMGRPRASVGAAVSTSAFYYAGAGSRIIQSHAASASQGLQIAQGTRLSATEYVNYQPFRMDRLFPGASDFSFGAPPAPPTDTFAGSEEFMDVGASLDLSHQVSRKASITGGYTYQSSQWLAASRQTVHGGRAGVGISIGRGLSMRLGYGLYQGRYRDVEARVVRNHTIDAGVDYSGALSLSRRTTLSFSTGSTAIRDRQQTHFRIVGRAQLAREIGRSWSAGLGYARDGFYVDQLREVVFSDAVTFSLGGLVTRRVSLHSGVGASYGSVGFGSGSNRASAIYGVAGLTTALTRLTAIGLDYSYYFHSFGADVALPGGVLSEIDRHSVRAYLTVWAPLFARVRSQNASR